jgi:hypothetical protein
LVRGGSGVGVVPVVGLVGVGELLVDVEPPLVGDVEHDSVTLAIGTFTGREIAEIGVPGGTLTVKVRVCPVTVLTVITQVSAETGIAASPITTSAAPAVMNPTISLRLLNTMVEFLPQLRLRKSFLPRTGATQLGRY